MRTTNIADHFMAREITLKSLGAPESGPAGFRTPDSHLPASKIHTEAQL